MRKDGVYLKWNQIQILEGLQARECRRETFRGRTGRDNSQFKAVWEAREEALG